MPRHPITVDDLWALPRVGSPSPSSDGKQIVVPVTTYSMEANEGTTRLWLVPADARDAGNGAAGDPARPLTSSDVSSAQPAFSPDNRKIAFVRKSSAASAGATASRNAAKWADQPQLHIISVEGGEAERLTDLPCGVADPRWFPDGKRIAFISEVYRDAPSLDATAKRAGERAGDPVKASVTEDRFYRYWDHWLTEGKVHHIFVYDIEARTIVDLTPDSKRMFDPDDPTDHYRISPDGRQIAFTALRSEPPHDPIILGVFTVDIDRPGMARCITPNSPADAFRPVYSPDGRWILYGMQREWDFYADKVRLVAYERATRRTTVLTEGWGLSADRWAFGTDPADLKVLRVYVNADIEGRIGIFGLEMKSALRSPSGARPYEILRGGAFSPIRIAGGRAFASRSSLTSPPEAVAIDLHGRNAGRVRDVTGFTGPKMSSIEISKTEEWIFSGAGDDPVQMFLVLPPGKRTVSNAPLVHMIHGGPHAAFHDEWHWRWSAQAFASAGYLVALVNFHGSTGWGQDFAASILGRWGDQPAADIMAATDLLISRGMVDPKRMAITGGSYGGYLVAWIASQTDRFAAAINHAGVSDFQTQYASDVTQGRARSMGGEPWSNVAGMDRYNPLRSAAGFRTPMLVIHGERDYRVPHAQGIATYNIYKAMKLPARLVYYPDENHWILKPRNSRHWYGEVHAWLDRWIGRKGGR
jgi:dipeptidyl aminopeptidase/acylaminoacyl peptidase